MSRRDDAVRVLAASWAGAARRAGVRRQPAGGQDRCGCCPTTSTTARGPTASSTWPGSPGSSRPPSRTWSPSRRWTATRPGPSKVDQAAELAKLTGLHGEFGKAIDFQGGEYGQAILSRFPLKVVDGPPAARQEEAGGPDRRRGARSSRATGGRRSRSSAPTSSTTTRRPARSRRRRSTSCSARRTGRSILAGDLNATPDSEPMKALAEKWTFATPPDKGLLTIPAGHAEAADRLRPVPPGRPVQGGRGEGDRRDGRVRPPAGAGGARVGRRITQPHYRCPLRVIPLRLCHCPDVRSSRVGKHRPREGTPKGECPVYACTRQLSGGLTVTGQVGGGLPATAGDHHRRGRFAGAN